MQLVILAGGKGTRLGLTDIPKPMCPIAGKPLLERQIELAKTYGFDEIFILSGHLAHVISDYFGDGSRWGVKIHHIVEDKPLGTAGALKLIENKLAENFMVIYGDVVMDFDMQAMLAFANRMPAVATLLVHPNNHPYDSDLLQIDSRGRVTALLPKPHPDGLIYHNLVNAAVYVFNKKILSYIAADTAQDFGKDIFPRLLQAGETLRAYHSAEYVKDMGTKDRLPVICADVESGKVSRLNKKNARPAVFLDRDGVLNRDMDKAPRAENFELLPGVSEAVRLLNQSDYLSIVVTNQPMIAKGFVTFHDVDEVHKRLETELGNEKAYLDGIYFCPHHPEKGFPLCAAAAPALGAAFRPWEVLSHRYFLPNSGTSCHAETDADMWSVFHVLRHTPRRKDAHKVPKHLRRTVHPVFLCPNSRSSAPCPLPQKR